MQTDDIFWRSMVDWFKFLTHSPFITCTKYPSSSLQARLLYRSYSFLSSSDPLPVDTWYCRHKIKRSSQALQDFVLLKERQKRCGTHTELIVGGSNEEQSIITIQNRGIGNNNQAGSRVQ